MYKLVGYYSITLLLYNYINSNIEVPLSSGTELNKHSFSFSFKNL